MLQKSQNVDFWIGSLFYIGKLLFIFLKIWSCSWKIFKQTEINKISEKPNIIDKRFGKI